jgi:hypothetical protein
VTVRRSIELAGDLLGAVLLAFGAIFEPKARPDDHWSTSPRVEVVEEASAEVAGALPRRRRLPATA